MRLAQTINLLLVLGAVAGVGTMYLYVATAIDYRHRDNGLAYILFVLGVGVWNGMFVTNYVVTDPMTEHFFLSLSMVGALLSGLGWFLFAGTASSTPELPARRPVFGTVAVLVGLGIALAMTAPVHEFYWHLDAGSQSSVAAITPAFGYWLHTVLLAGLFGTGTVLFAAAAQETNGAFYPRWYALFGTLAVLAVLGSNVLYPGEESVAPLAAVLLTTVGWLQAKRWEGFRRLRDSLTRAHR